MIRGRGEIVEQDGHFQSYISLDSFRSAVIASLVTSLQCHHISYDSSDGRFRRRCSQ